MRIFAASFLLMLLAFNCKDRGNEGHLSAESTGSGGDRIVVIALNDVHGSFDANQVNIGRSGKQQLVYAGGLENLDSYLAILRKKYPNRVIVLDAGDIYQGTLFSNYFQGRSLVAAYNELGVDATAVGNHEFDFGPLKLKTSEKEQSMFTSIPPTDRIGSFRAIAKMAKYKILTSNIMLNGRNFAGQEVPEVASSVMIERGGRKIGIVGATTTNTLLSGTTENLGGMDFIEIAETAIKEAKDLRSKGAEAIILVTHAGGSCRMSEAPADGDKACATPLKDEVTEALDKAPKGTFDLVVAGHMHAPQAHMIRGTAVLQNYDGALSFARADLVFEQSNIKSEIIGHTYLCESHFENYSSCNPKSENEGATYPADLGKPISPTFLGERVEKSARLANALASYKSEVNDLLQKPITKLPAELVWNRLAESPMGNCFADLMVSEARQLITEKKFSGVETIDGGMFSSGGIRKGLPADVRYGNVYAVAPFDGDGMVVVEIAAKHVTKLAKIFGPTAKSILVISEGWKSIVGPEGDNVARGAKLPPTIDDSPQRKIRVLAFSYFVGNGEQLPTRLEISATDVRVVPLPGETRDHLESALKRPSLPKSCLAPAAGPLRTVRS